MPSQDETQKLAELRQAFLRHLPKRMEALARRGSLMCTRGWDINLLIVLHRQVQDLSGICGRYGLLDLSTLLSRIENGLQVAIEFEQLPDPEQSAILADDFAAIAVAVEQLRTDQRESAPAVALEDRAAVDGVTLQVVPPAEFIARFARPLANANFVPAAVLESASTAVAPIDAERAEAAPLVAPIAEPGPSVAAAAAPRSVSVAAPSAKPVAAQAARRLYHLSDASSLSDDVDQRLLALGLAVEPFHDADEMIEVIGALTPNVVLVDASYGEMLESIGAALRGAREKANQRLALVVLSTSAEIPARLAAMRAGADSFLALPASAGDIVLRVQELLAAETAEPFRVMIVEDDRSQALFAESILRKAGMRTIAVTDPLATIEALESFDPELILMDLYMPNCDGMELTTLIREREQFISTPIVFLSGEHDADKRFDALSAGGDDYLEKPIRPKYLISAVTNRVRRARSMNQRAKARSPRDPVTGLFHRAYVIDRVGEQVAAEIDGVRPGGVLFLIVEGAATTRERIGLSAFDALMLQVGTVLAGQVAETNDLPSRFGDTSFLLYCPQRLEDELLELGTQVRACFEKHLFGIGDHSLNLAVSIGIATFAQGWSDAGALLNAAERAAAQARSGQGNKVRVFETQITAASSSEEDALVESVKDALQHDRFQLVFQPIASLRGAGEEQFQVLLRLRSEGGRLYTGAVLMPAIERAGISGGVDRWVVARALMVIQERERMDRPLRMFVHQSLDSLLDPQRGAWLRQQLESRKVPGERLVLIFRYADVSPRVKQAMLFADQIKPLGVRLAIAGFEATMAAFQMLQHLPAVEQIKLAAQYVNGESQNPKNRQELRQLVSFAHERQIRVIAPQVEDAQTAASLWTTGVDYIQGDFVQSASSELDFDFHASAL